MISPSNPNPAFKQYDWIHFFNTYCHHVTPSDTVLEIGASNPDKTIPLAQKCRHLIGIEKHLSRLPKYQTDNIKIIQTDWEKLRLKFNQNYFDIIVASHVLEHVTDDHLVLEQSYQVLKPGGILLLNTPNRLRLTRRLIELFQGPRQFPWWEHIREYSYSDLITLLSSTSFKRFTITPVALGLHAGNFKLYLPQVPRPLLEYANYWEIMLYK